MLNYCVNLLQSKAQSKRQNLQLQTFELNLKGSRDKLWRVVSNLISNAIKFSPDEAIIKIAMQKKQHSVLISVADSGIGISEEMQDKIFELYTDAKREGTAGEETYGLGLFISKQIVLAHNGKIWCESVPGLGSTFYVDLPL
ncbi:MAG: ATP-binding protein [Pedobacter sp.]|nr:MAG: ATP-binding protein [Pedobacter sp.]